MTNDLTLVVAMMTELNIITEKEGSALAKKMQETNIPSSFDESLYIVGKIFAELGINKELDLREIVVGGNTITVSK